jgi:hypothetical protein
MPMVQGYSPFKTYFGLNGSLDASGAAQTSRTAVKEKPRGIGGYLVSRSGNGGRPKSAFGYGR